ncbi:MAG: AtpZ/AtpI family protein [Candidatus Obscuribacterales bacterium]|nr:AtpZ/AtpI family protein [Candidatus Obscuribacterales bacterium]
MKETPTKDQVNSEGPSAWGMAYQWGTALVAYTCILGFAGYFIGDRLGGQVWSIILLMLGLFTGFSAAIYQIFKTSQKIDKAIPNRGEPLPDDPVDEAKSNWV